MKLRELCSEFKYECLSGSMDVDVRDVIYDSRKITEGTVFVCMVGAVTDGHKYIPDAVKKGASAIVVERADEAQQIPDQVTVIQVESARRALAYMSAALFGHPDRPAAPPHPQPHSDLSGILHSDYNGRYGIHLPLHDRIPGK